MSSSTMSEASVCTFCNRSFKRIDALKRHLNICRVRVRQGSAIPSIPSNSRGRRRRACDACSHRKRACPLGLPCAACVEGNRLCTYDRNQVFEATTSSTARSSVNGDVSRPRRTSLSRSLSPSISTRRDASDYFEDWEGVMEAAFEQQEDAADNPSEPELRDATCIDSVESNAALPWIVSTMNLMTPTFNRPTALNIDVLASFPFLTHLTSHSGLAVSFDCGSRDLRAELVANACDFRDADVLSSVNYDSAALNQTSNYGMGLWNLSHDASELMISHGIVAQIRDLTNYKHRKSIISFTWSHSLETLCYEMFSPRNIRKFLLLYWTCWYPNWPTIHRPTFKTGSSSLSLLAAMTILGACLSPIERDRAMSSVWFNAVEEMVFEDDLWANNIMSTWQDSTQKAERDPLIQLLQAAYIVCLFQTWEGSRESKRRVRRHRYSTIINSIRDFGTRSASLRSIDTSSIETFEWEEYIQRESFIRIVTYVYNLDVAFALFYHYPPRMMLSDLNIDIVSPETCFQAESAEECFICLKVWRDTLSSGRELTIASSIKALCSDVLDGEHAFVHYSVLNMFTVLTALYSTVYQIQYSSLNVSDKHRVHNGLKHWASLWPSRVRDEELASTISVSTSGRWKRVGFMRYAPEYWLLIQITLNQINEEADAPPAESVFEDDDMSKVRALLTQCQIAAHV